MQEDEHERPQFVCETQIDDQVLRLHYYGFTPTSEQIAPFSAPDLYFDSRFPNSSPSRIISNPFECLFYDGIVHCFWCGTAWEEMLKKLVRNVPLEWCRRAPGITIEGAHLSISNLEVKFPAVVRDQRRDFCLEWPATLNEVSILLEDCLGQTVERFRTKSGNDYNGNDEQITICQLLEEGEPIELIIGTKRQPEEFKPIPLFTITPWRRVERGEW
jgi:hypothetical protein